MNQGSSIHMRTFFRTAAISVGVALLSSSCIMRSTEDYQADTRRLVETQNGSLTQCLDKARVGDPQASGDVVATFEVAKKTGVITNPMIDEAKSTAPKPVQDCVLDALTGLVLDPGDMGTGQVTATWSLGG